MKEHTMPEDDIDTELEVWDQFVTAVRWLACGPRPGLTLATATEEALMGWVAEQAALEHGSEPFAATQVPASLWR
jgi:hypothetical protein